MSEAQARHDLAEACRLRLVGPRPDRFWADRWGWAGVAGVARVRALRVPGVPVPPKKWEKR